MLILVILWGYWIHYMSSCFKLQFPRNYSWGLTVYLCSLANSESRFKTLAMYLDRFLHFCLLQSIFTIYVYPKIGIEFESTLDKKNISQFSWKHSVLMCDLFWEYGEHICKYGLWQSALMFQKFQGGYSFSAFHYPQFNPHHLLVQRLASFLC